MFQTPLYQRPFAKWWWAYRRKMFRIFVAKKLIDLANWILGDSNEKGKS